MTRRRDPRRPARERYGNGYGNGARIVSLLWSVRVTMMAAIALAQLIRITDP
jgi:hypothetical protein